MATRSAWTFPPLSHQTTVSETTPPPISALAESGGIPRRWDTFSDAPEPRRKMAVSSNLARVNRRPLACRGMTLFRLPKVLRHTVLGCLVSIVLV